MQLSGNRMEKTCAMLDRLVLLLDLEGVPALPFVGPAGVRFYNPPAPHLEVVYLERGACPDLRVGNLPHPLAAGQVSLHNVHFGNHSSFHEGGRAWCVFVALGEGWAELAAAPFAQVLPAGPPDELLALFERVTRLAHRAGRGPDAYLAPQPLYQPADTARHPGLAAQLRGALLELFGYLREQAGGTAAVADQVPRAVRQAAQHLALHYHDPELDLARLARTVGLSPNHLGRLFRLALGTAPMQYLQRLRLQHARLLLERTELRVKEVAREVGYRDALYFSRLYHREQGHPPREEHRATSRSGQPPNSQPASRKAR
jgi:AraC-like DNA-binding protein